MKLHEGKCGVSVRILVDSISNAGVRFITMEITYPRIILAELNTHRMLSKNSASSRAIPFAKMTESLHGAPVRFGKAQPGMQDAGEHSALINDAYTAEEWWKLAKLSATNFAQGLHDAGFAKQVYNRLTEPFQVMKTVISGTEWPNFFWLRDHEAADPTLHELAHLMNQARNESVPTLLQAGEWHLPYILTWRSNGVLHYGIEADNGGTIELTLEDAIQVSCARCAAVSFRNVDYGIEKSREVYARLVGDQRKHASAFEHCGTPMDDDNVANSPLTWEKGISHMDRNLRLWSGNLRGWIQYRKLIDGENYEE